MPRISAADRKIQFVEAAARVIAEEGVAKATTRRIAEAANAPLATLYYCFDDKEDLFFEVFRAVASRAIGTTPLDRTDDLASGATEMFDRRIAYILDHPLFVMAEVDLFVWLTRHNPGLAARSYEMYAQTLTAVLTETFSSASPQSITGIVRVLMTSADGITVAWASNHDATFVRETAAAIRAGIPAMVAALSAGPTRPA